MNSKSEQGTRVRVGRRDQHLHEILMRRVVAFFTLGLFVSRVFIMDAELILSAYRADDFHSGSK